MWASEKYIMTEVFDPCPSDSTVSRVDTSRRLGLFGFYGISTYIGYLVTNSVDIYIIKDF